MKELEESFLIFQKKYPNLLKEYPRSGFYLCVGWKDLVTHLFDTLESHIERLPIEIRADVYCAQVKEKFGTLRVYMNQETPFVSGAIAVAESMSSTICDTCGHPGKLRTNKGWYRTLCEDCSSERK